MKKTKQTKNVSSLKKPEQTKNIRPMFYMGALVIIFIIAFSYIFNSKLDLNGDNADYYILATSLAQGDGYSNIANDPPTPSNWFPPGYPLLMSVIRIFTDSIFPQKVFNGLLLLASALIFFYFLRKNNQPDSLAFIACCAIILNFRLLHFATMMMSEMSFLFFTALSLLFLFKMDDEKPFWKDVYFYLAILTIAYSYHIRTQGVALCAAVLGFFLFTKRWKQMLAFAGGFVVCLLPWMLRNKLGGFDQSRYLDTIAVSNLWRPEEGALSTGEIISRFFETFKMLITKAVPNSIIPYFTVDYNAAATFGEWCIAIVLFTLIGIGMWRFGKFKYIFLFYTLATFCVISLFSTPSENRYITALLPFLEVSLFVGIYFVLSRLIQKTKITKTLSPWFLIVLLFFSFPKLEALHIQNKQPYHPAYANFFKIGEELKKQVPSNTVVVSRKPALLYMFSKTAVTGYKWTLDDQELIEGLIDSKADYVILEQLGYSSTARYLYPAIEKNPELFPIVIHLKNPDTYLLKFERDKAIEKFDYTPKE